MKNLSLISACLLLGACGSTPAPLDSGLAAPPQWRYLAAGRSDASDIRQWWKAFGAPELDSLLQRALLNSQDLGAAVARVRQAQASAVIAGAPLLPELNATLGASRQKLLRDSGYSGTDATSDNDAVDSFSAGLSASYEVDFWGGRRAAYRSALESLKSSEYDRATVELTLLSGVANSYLQVLALREQQRIARLNLDNAEHVLRLVETRHAAGSATALEVAQQSSLVASQRKQLPLLEQQAHEALITLATLIGEPVQALQVAERPFDSLRWPETGAGLPSELLSRRPDIANAEAQLAAAQADVQVARAALFPKLTLSASLSSGANRAADTFRNPYYNLGANLLAPIFNHGRLRAERDRSLARQEELLETYRKAILTAFADTERSLNSIDGLDRQLHWQQQELEQAQRAFDLSDSRYQAGAETLLTVLETQRTLYAAQDAAVQCDWPACRPRSACTRPSAAAGRATARVSRGKTEARVARASSILTRSFAVQRLSWSRASFRLRAYQGRRGARLSQPLNWSSSLKMMRKASFMVSTSSSTELLLAWTSESPHPWVAGPSQGSPTSTHRPGANHWMPSTSRRCTSPGWKRSWARYQSSMRSSIQPWNDQNTGFTWEENGSPRKSFSGRNQRGEKSDGTRSLITGAPLEGSRVTEAQRICSQSCMPSSISEPN